MSKKLLGGLVALVAMGSFSLPVSAAGYAEIGQYGRPGVLVTADSQEQIDEEIRLGDMELIAQLVEAEAGNQDFEGKCLIVDVILNRVESPDFPNTVEEVIFQEGQFSVIKNGAFDKAAWNMQESDYAAVAVEYEMHSNKDVLYFNNCSIVAGTGRKFKVGDHYFREG
jgi:N-acetylmuramoyl-L-alanine amidase